MYVRKLSSLSMIAVVGVVACSPAATVVDQGLTTGAAGVSASAPTSTPTRLSSPQGIAEDATPTPVLSLDPPTPTPTAIPTAVRIAMTSLSLPGGPRVYIEGEIQIDGLAEGWETTGRTLTLSLRTPQLRPDGRSQSRGFINFGKWLLDGNPQLDNYIDIPTIDGPLRLHLNRDGTLQFEEDGGAYTSPFLMPGGSALTYEIELDREILPAPAPYRFRMLSSAPIMIDAELQLSLK
jgi:hypothetical protein